jgi:hypothetical protein
MRMKEKLALHSAAELRQKAREWLAKSAVNRIREDPESELEKRARIASLSKKPAFGAGNVSDAL